MERIAYGREPSQFGELTRGDEAPGEPRIAVLVHGGFWRAAYDLSLMRDLAADLAARGWTTWNLEYRRLGAGGGWPATFDDVAAAIDHLAALDVDSSRVVAIGHSAGGHLAVLAAGRRSPRVPLSAVISQAGVLDLAGAVRDDLGRGAVAAFLGGSPDELPERYRAADPLQAAPLAVPVLCVHARADVDVPFAQSVAYVAAAIRAGGHAVLHEVPGDHYTPIDPTAPAWALVRDALLPELLAAALGPGE